MKYVVLIGRILYAWLFISNALFGHFMNHGMLTQYAEMQGVPLAGVMVIISGLLIFFGGLSVLLGYKVKIGAILILLFLLPVTFMMHNFWVVSDPQMVAMQQAMFWKNLALAGAALLIYYFGSGPLSLDKNK